MDEPQLAGRQSWNAVSCPYLAIWTLLTENLWLLRSSMSVERHTTVLPSATNRWGLRNVDMPEEAIPEEMRRLQQQRS